MALYGFHFVLKFLDVKSHKPKKRSSTVYLCQQVASDIFGIFLATVQCCLNELMNFLDFEVAWSFGCQNVLCEFAVGVGFVELVESAEFRALVD